MSAGGYYLVKKKDEVWYFAYGSNLNIGQMMSRVGEWTVSKRALVCGYRLVFNVQSSRWGGLAANIKRTDNPDDKVYGAIYRITRDKLDVLKSYENKPPVDITVDSDGQRIESKVFIFDPSKKSGKPPDSYINVMSLGLKQHGYPEAVIEEVEKAANNCTR